MKSTFLPKSVCCCRLVVGSSGKETVWPLPSHQVHYHIYLTLCILYKWWKKKLKMGLKFAGVFLPFEHPLVSPYLGIKSQACSDLLCCFPCYQFSILSLSPCDSKSSRSHRRFIFSSSIHPLSFCVRRPLYDDCPSSVTESELTEENNTLFSPQPPKTTPEGY